MNDVRVIFQTSLLLLTVGFLAGCSSARDAAYRQSVEQWRQEHLAKVTSEDGDLTYTTCPLPTPGNRLQVEIPAGEKSVTLSVCYTFTHGPDRIP